MQGSSAMLLLTKIRIKILNNSYTSGQDAHQKKNYIQGVT